MMGKTPNPQPQKKNGTQKTAEIAQPVPQTTVKPDQVPEKTEVGSNANMAAADLQAAEAKRLADEKAASDAAQAKNEAEARGKARLAAEKAKQLPAETRIAAE